jgi:hypothetical protein
MYMHNFLQAYSGFLLQVIVPQQTTHADYISTSDPGTLHFPYLHTLVISSCFDVPHFLRNIFSVILDGCMSVTSWHCFWVSITDVGKHLYVVNVICYASRLKDMEFTRPFGSAPIHLCQAFFLFIPVYFLSSPTSLSAGHI